MPSFPFYPQLNTMDCGPACLRMVAKYYGKNIPLHTLREASQIGKEGVSMLGMSEAAEKYGFSTRAVKLSFHQLIHEAQRPAILHWAQNHFVILLPEQRRRLFMRFAGRRTTNKVIQLADPACGIITVSVKDFKEQWLSNAASEEQEATGIALLLEPSISFYNNDEIDMILSHDPRNAALMSSGNTSALHLFITYLKQHKKLIVQLFLGLLVGSMLQLIFPFLTQGIVDTGINTHDLQFIYIILVAQFMLFFSRTIVDFIRSRILLYLSTRINISLLSSFWTKLMKLPFHFFDSRHTGDIMQRISDMQRIENFLTGQAINTLFSLFSFVIFSIVLLVYNTSVFFIFITGSILYVAWVCFFLQYRRRLDYSRFAIAGRENTATMELVLGMPEIKLNNAEQQKRWAWENLQAALFNLNFKSLSLSQYQQVGAFFINEGKNILITFFVAKSVLEGKLTLGAMLAVQYIMGQLNSPVEQLIGFVQQAQDAKISLERIHEVYLVPDEEPVAKEFIRHLPSGKSIYINDLSFTYTGAGNEPVLRNINLIIPEGKITAIVGTSGSGKTTLLKLLLRFYENYTGTIGIGEPSISLSGGLKNYAPSYWRSQCGAVMQEGFIFNDTIANNIAVGKQEDISIPYANRIDAMRHACRVANILSFIESLPLGFNTRIGADANGISAGQKQRILIARAVYKNPHYLFFDEATNALDANNEKEILEHLQEFFKGKTVVIVAHRLSTVKHADNIVVLNKGMITEQGTHEELSRLRGEYYQLVKNQLELGN